MLLMQFIMFQVVHFVESPHLTRNKNETHTSFAQECRRLHFCEIAPNVLGCLKVTYRQLLNIIQELEDYKLLSTFKKQVDCCKKLFKETKKSKTQTTMREMIKQTTKTQQKTTKQCKFNNTRNEHHTNGLLQRSVYKNKK